MTNASSIVTLQLLLNNAQSTLTAARVMKEVARHVMANRRNQRDLGTISREQFEREYGEAMPPLHAQIREAEVVYETALANYVQALTAN